MPQGKRLRTSQLQYPQRVLADRRVTQCVRVPLIVDQYQALTEQTGLISCENLPRIFKLLTSSLWEWARASAFRGRSVSCLGRDGRALASVRPRSLHPGSCAGERVMVSATQHVYELDKAPSYNSVRWEKCDKHSVAISFSVFNSKNILN